MTTSRKTAKALGKDCGAMDDEPSEPIQTPDVRAKSEADTRAGARLILLREQAERAEAFVRPVLDRLDQFAAAAAELGRADVLAIVDLTKLAAVKGDHAVATRNIERIVAALAPKHEVKAADREVLIEAVAKLGLDAANEALRRARTYARRK